MRKFSSFDWREEKLKRNISPNILANQNVLKKTIIAADHYNKKKKEFADHFA